MIRPILLLAAVFAAAPADAAKTLIVNANGYTIEESGGLRRFGGRLGFRSRGLGFLRAPDRAGGQCAEPGGERMVEHGGDEDAGDDRPRPAEARSQNSCHLPSPSATSVCVTTLSRNARSWLTSSSVPV